MASTIITKNNTTGTPGVSDLVQGELAINVGNGSLYYGAAGGTAVSQSFTFSDITASGTINTANIYAGRFFQGTQEAGANISTIYAPIASPTFTGNIGMPNGSIDHAFLGADIVDGDNIANDAVDTEHIADDAIEEEHIGDGEVKTAAIADAQVTVAKMANLADMKVLGNVSGTAAAPAAVAITNNDALGTSDTVLCTQGNVKAYVDARYSYQYISFFGAVSAANNNSGGPYYIFVSGNGISNHSWTKYNTGAALAITNDTIDLATDGNCSELAVSTYLGTNQIVVPQTSQIVGFYATNRSNSNGYHVGNALFVIPEANVNWGDSTAMTAYLKYRSISSAHTGTTNNFSNSNVNTSKIMMCHDMARGVYDVAAGSIIVPSMFCDTHSQAFQSSMTIVLRTLIQ